MKNNNNFQPATERRFFENKVQIRALEDQPEEESRTIEGYAFKYEVWSRLINGWFYEKIARGFLDDIRLNEADILALFNHNYDKVLARTISRTLDLVNDETGLLYRFEAPNTTTGNDLLESVRRGDIQHSSFGFIVKEDKWEYDDDDNDKRTLIKAESITDVSPVTQPAYLDTTVAQRSYEAFKKQVEGLQKYHRREMARRKLHAL
jgi:uncharacterized protein